MCHRKWLSCLMIFLILFIFLGLGHGTIAAVYGLLYSVDWKMVSVDISALFQTIPFILLLSMYVIARGWYGMRVSFTALSFLGGMIGAILLLSASYFVHNVGAQVFHGIIEQIAASVEGLGHSFFYTILIAGLGWWVYLLLLFVAYSFLLSMLYVLPGTNFWNRYATFFRSHLAALLGWSLFFSVMHTVFVGLSVVYRIQMIAQLIGDTVFGTDRFSKMFIHLYAGEMAVSVIFTGAMLWVVVSWFARVQRRPVQPMPL